MKKTVLWTLACLFVGQPFHALKAQQSLQAEYYSIDEGLSERLITDVAIGKEDFIWLATENGLNRFDGYEFIVFNNRSKDKTKNWLSSNNIKNIFTTPTHDLVIVYNNNVTSFDLFNTESHTNRKISLLPEFGINGIVRDLMVDRQGQVFVATANQSGLSVYQFDGRDRFFKVFELPAAYVNPSINVELLHTHDDRFFIFDSEKGLRVLNRKGKVLKAFGESRFECMDDWQQIPSSIYFMHEDKKGQVWVSLFGIKGVFRYDAHNQMFERPEKIDQSKIYSNLWEDNEGNILLAHTRGSGIFPPLLGLYCWSNEEDFHDFSSLIASNRGVIAIAGRNFFKHLYIAMDTGFKIVPNSHSPVKTYLSRGLSVDQRGAVIRGITGDKDHVYFSREVEAWYMLDKITDKLDTLRLIDESTGEEVDFSCGMDVKLDANGQLWGITCYKSTLGQLHQLNMATRTVKTYRFDYVFNAFTIDNDGVFWLGCSVADQKGLLVNFDPKTLRFMPFYDRENKNILENAIPRYLKITKDGMLWAGTENGLYRIDRKKRSSKVFYSETIENGNVQGLSDNTIYVIEEMPDGNIMVGAKNGLNILNPTTGETHIYTKNNGLASNTVCGIVPDGKGNYWISTFNGLSFFSYDKQSFHNFYESDGFSHNEFNRFSFYRDAASDRYFFGGVNGLNAFYPKDLLIGREVPQPVLTKISRHNNRLDSLIIQDENLSALDKLIIEPSDSYFSIHFALPPTAKAKRNQFKIKLEGVDQKWLYLGTTPSVTYNHLPAGDYVLLIKGADSNGNWSDKVLRVPIKVRQIFYKTWWFIFLLAMTLILLGNWIFRSQLEQRLKVERLRTKLSSDLHDELSGLLSGIAMQAEMLELQTKEEDMRARLQAIGEVSRKAMSKMSDVIWSIDSRKDRFSDLMLRMQEHAAEILSPLDIGYEFQVARIDSEHKIPVHIRQDLYFIFKEAINNVAKHSNASMVTIVLQNSGLFFEMVIKDNGRQPGLSQHKVNGNGLQKKTGQGLSNLKMRAERIKGELHIENTDGFAVCLKMKNFSK